MKKALKGKTSRGKALKTALIVGSIVLVACVLGFATLSFRWLTATELTALSTLALAVLTAVIAYFAFQHIYAIRRENKKALTLEACTRYDSDPVVIGATSDLRAALANGTLKNDPKKFRNDLVILFNYLDTVAIGVAQNIYIEEMAMDHLKPILIQHFDEYIGFFKEAELSKSHIQCLIDLKEHWSKEDTQFRDDD